MTTSSKRIVFFGTDDFSVPSLAALIEAGYQIVAVVTKPDAAIGRHHSLVAPPVKALAEQHDIPVLQPVRASDAITDLQNLQPDAGVVVAYGKILPSALIELFAGGLINVHTSLLPRYRGASPIESAILNGDFETGVTLMQIDTGMDTGPIFTQSHIKLTGKETRPDLYEVLSHAGADLLIKTLPAILDGQLTAKPQNHAEAVAAGMIKKSDGMIDWTHAATEIERHIRAYLGWPGSKATIDDVECTIIAAHAGDSQPFLDSDDAGTLPGRFFKNADGQMAVTTGHGELIIDRIKPAGKREMTGREFMAGHPLD